MAKTKMATKSHHKKRYGQHKKHSHSYRKVYWPYIPMLLMLFVVLVMGSVQPRQLGRVLGAHSRITPLGLLTETNQERDDDGLAPLSMNQQLSDAALTKANDMKSRNYWSHQTPDGEEPWTFIEQEDYTYKKAGENLAYGFLTNEATVTGWMQSQSHRDNMLNTSYTEVGFGVVVADDYRGKGTETIVVAFYATPQTSQLAVVQPTTSLGGFANSQQPVPFISSILNGNFTWASFAIGAIIGIGSGFLIGRHLLRLKRMLQGGEHFVMHHPLLDISVTSAIVVGILLLQTVGYIG